MNERNSKPSSPVRAQKAEPAMQQPATELSQDTPPNETQATPAADEERGPGVARTPFGSQRQKLAAEHRPGYVRRWFNDDPGRIQQAKNAGYAHVKDATGTPRTYTVGVAAAGGGLKAYLMEIPEEFYSQDQAAKMSAIDELDAQISRCAVNGEPGTDGKYVPKKPDGRSVIDIRTSSR